MNEGYDPLAQPVASQNEEVLDDGKREKYSLPPENWVAVNSLRVKYGKRWGLVKPSMNPERSPNDVKLYLDRHGHPRYYASPELIETTDRELEEVTRPPEGWLNNRNLATQLERDNTTIRKIAESFRAEHPDWFEVYLDSVGKQVTYYSPQLVEAITKKSEELKYIEGWMAAATLGKETKKDREAVANRAEKYRQDHPEWFKPMLSSGGIAEYYSPELVSVLKEEFKQSGSLLHGWFTPKALARVKGMPSAPTIKLFVEQFKKDHPEWFKKDELTKNLSYEYYSPELIKLIQDEFLEHPARKEGWATAGDLAKRSKRSYFSVKRIADQFRVEHPEWFEPQRAKNGVYEFYSPELINLIEQALEENKVPDGWLTRLELANKLGVYYQKAEKTANKYRTEHPEWFQFYLSRRGHKDEHYSPELVKTVSEIIGEKKDIQKRKSKIKTEKKDRNQLEETIEVDNLTDRFVTPDGRVWISTDYITRVHKPGIENVAGRLSSVSRIRLKDKLNRERSMHLETDVLAKIRVWNRNAELPKANENETYTDKRGRNWVTGQFFIKNYNLSHQMLIKYLEGVPFIPGRANNGHEVFLYRQDKGEKAIEKLIELYKLPQTDDETGVYTDENGVGWVTKFHAINKLLMGKPLLNRVLEKVSFIKGRSKTGAETVLYNQAELLDKIEFVPDGWQTTNKIADELGISYYWVKKIVEPFKKSHPGWFITRSGKDRAVASEYFHPELKRIIKEEVEKFQKWETVGSIREKLQEEGIEISTESIRSFADTFLKQHPDWFLTKSPEAIGNKGTLYSYQLTEKILENFRQYPPPPDNWKMVSGLVEELEVPIYTIIGIAREYLKEKPEWSREFKDIRGIGTYYSPELVEKIVIYTKEMLSFMEGSMSSEELATELGFSKSFIVKSANEYRVKHPEWFKNYFNKTGQSIIRYHKELVDTIKSELSQKKESVLSKDKEKKLKDDLADFAEEINVGEKIDAQEFRKLIKIFGSSKVVDILYKFNPEFRGLPVQFVKSVIADYIGDFLVTNRGYRDEDLGLAMEYLKEPGFKEALFEVMKENCLDYYHQEKRTNPELPDQVIIQNFIDRKKIEGQNFKNDDFMQVVQSLSDYYFSVLSIKKPERVVDELKPGRKFPDINQCINIKEISDKRRMLIADEMGLGKSASAILTKESLGLRQALIIVPSNVEDTWNGYLHDYFKDGKTPKFLIIEELSDFEGDLSEYEYIIISHEKLNTQYTQKILELNPDMLIVDEVHKLKKIKEGTRRRNGTEYKTGIRSKNLIAIANKIQGDNKYLAILSGTPVPNKIIDVAMLLKLLYPEMFKDISNKAMVRNIIRGDMIDLKNLLIPRMQMKSLRECVEMPQHIENPPIEYELSDTEKDIYGAILEEDEFEATKKIRILRKFLMNPETVDATPGIVSAKISKLQETLDADFKKVNKIVMFVNNYIDGVIRGEKSIIPELNLPPDVELLVIEGHVTTEERQKIQDKLNNSNGRIFLVVSGLTADVGVDFSGGEMVYFYNEPWTRFDMAQQLSRVYRPGLKNDLESKVFIAKGTIEEGIHRFIEIKKRAVEKLLKGIPPTELERDILAKMEGQDEDKEVNPEVARSYFSTWELAMQIFGENMEIGEKDFKKYLIRKSKEITRGEEYAKVYFELGSRSYQANANRIASTLIADFMEKSGREPEEVKILDMASGPEMLKKHGPEKVKDRITSIDINPWHFSWQKGDNRVIGELTKLPFANDSFDYINLTFAIHYFRMVPTKGEIDRMFLLGEINRVLKVGGRAIIDIVHSVEMKDYEGFKENIKRFGLRVVEDYTGNIESGEYYKSKLITLEKTDELPEDFSIDKMMSSMDSKDINSFKFRDPKKKKTKTRLKDQRKIITNFQIGNNLFEINFNEADRVVYAEEQVIIQKGQELKETHGSIEEIPKDEVVNNSFVRYRPEKGYNYRLFRKLKVDQGGVVIK